MSARVVLRGAARRPGLRERDPGSSRLLAIFLAGAAAGLVMGWAVGRRDGAGTPDDAPRRGPHWGRWNRAWDGAVEGLGQARDVLLGAPEMDVGGVQRRVEGLPGGEGVRVRGLGRGIVEVVGRAADDEAAARLLEAAAAEPGVEVVVNRIWTPTSGH